ncbi:MAG: Rqc2 family fibronectin-binding protein [Schwartzia sp. (in: firmicutes)]
MSLDGFSLHRLIEELNANLSGGRIDKVNQPNRHTLQLSIRQPGKNHLLLISIQPQNPILYQPAAAIENPAEPPTFCMVLRKYLEGGRIAAIAQMELDRIVRLEVDCIGSGGRLTTRTLMIELMGKYSNVILVEDGLIFDAMRRIGTNASRIRRVLPGLPYEWPPAQEKQNILTASLDDILAQLFALKEKPLAVAIRDVCLGFGPVTAKEIAFAAALAPDTPVAALTKADATALQAAFTKIRSATADPTTTPYLVLDENQKVQAMAAFPLHSFPGSTASTFSTMNDMVARASILMDSYVPPDKERFRKLLRSERNRAEKKKEKLLHEAAAAENAEEMKIAADNLMTYQYQLTDHIDDVFTAPNIYDPTGETLTIPLDQRLTINQNIQSYYHKYNKLKRAQTLLKAQIDECSDNIRYLASIEASLSSSSTLADLSDIRAELIAGGWLKENNKKKPREKLSRPFSFIAPDGCEILVGKNNYQNDRLTFKTADKDDIWLHTKDIPGSHVILRTDGREPSPDALMLAASLAAHFSQGADSSNVPVDYTQCRFVKKPSGAKPGFVIFTNQKTLYVTPDKQKITTLLAGQSEKD